MRRYDQRETQDWTAESWMWTALREGDINDLKQIFAERKPNPDCAEKYDGDTPLSFAVRKGDVSLAEFLITQGAEVARPMGYLQYTPLHIAADKGETEMVALLLKNGADANGRTRYGETPMHRASWGGHDKAIAALIVAKGDVDAQNDMGQTPLHCAISSNKADTVKLLLEWDADITRTDIDGLTPKNFATRLVDMLMGSPNPQLTHIQFMQHSKNLDKIHEYLDNSDTLRDCTNIDHMKGAFNKGSKREVTSMKPIGIKPPQKPPAAGFQRQ
jgi:ankyrin repeat protein